LFFNYSTDYKFNQEDLNTCVINNKISDEVNILKIFTTYIPKKDKLSKNLRRVLKKKNINKVKEDYVIKNKHDVYKKIANWSDYKANLTSVCLCSKQNPKKYIDDYEKNAQEIKRKEREELNRMIKEQNEKTS